MPRLQSELHRLYLPQPAASPGMGATTPSLISSEGQVRAMVLALAHPASWELLAKVWRGAQVDLDLPAPAIAVSGTDALQLWFSLAEPIAATAAHAFLESLRWRYLPDIALTRIGLMPVADASAPHRATHAAQVPAEQGQTGNWSAFVAPDLAPVFADTPWLDMPPSREGQADLLSRLGSIKPLAWEAALARLRPAAPEAPRTSTASLPTPLAAAASMDAKRFLRQVMHDDTVALALRIEAAKALLPYADD